MKGFDDEFVQAYFDYHVDTAVIYGADRFTAELEAKSVLNFEIEIAKVDSLSSKFLKMILSKLVSDFNSKRRKKKYDVDVQPNEAQRISTPFPNS